jgi:glycosyltransferase involved in cell wall biosynthesis
MAATDDTAYDDVTVTVVIPYAEEFTPPEMLEEALDSAEAQREVGVEPLVVEDEELRGPAWARNRGLERAETRYVAFLDGDDLWAEDKLVRQLRRMEETGAGMCVEGHERYEPLDFARALLVGETFALTSAILIDTDRVDTRFDESLERREDHLFMIETAVDAGVCFVSDTFEARKYEDGLSEHVEKSEDHVDRFFEVLTDRVPETERFRRAYYRNAYVFLGRARHHEGNYREALSLFVRSLRLGPSVAAVGAFGITVLVALYDLPTRPLRRRLAGGTHE